MTIERKKFLINIRCYLFLAVSFVLVFLFPMALAKDSNASEMAMLDQIMKGPLSMILETIIKGEGQFGGLWNIATGDIPEGVLSTAYQGMKVIGAIYVIIVCTSNAFKEIENEVNPMEAMSKAAVEFFITALIIINATEIVDTICSLGTAAIEYFGSETIEESLLEDGVKTDVLKALDPGGSSSGGIFWSLGIRTQLLLPWALSFLVSIGGKFVIIQIALEIFIRKFFTPIAIGDVYKEGLRSPGVRWLKRILGAYLKAAVCVAVSLLISSYVTTSLIGHTGSVGDIMETLIGTIAVNLTSIAIMMKAGEYTNDIVGA
nr:hypothetical protein [uncultured Butyrivibrio sp.]